MAEAPHAAGPISGVSHMTVAIELSELNHIVQTQGLAISPPTARRGNLVNAAMPPSTEHAEQSLNRTGRNQNQRHTNAPSMIARDAQLSGDYALPLTTAAGEGTSVGRVIGPPVSMDDRILNFQEVEARRLGSHQQDLENERSLRARNKINNQQKRTLEALRQWNKAQEEELPLLGSDPPPLWKVFSKKIWPSKIPTLPSFEKLMSLVYHYYPPREQVEIEVCDFGPGKATHFTTTLPGIQDCWKQKPEWATVRWIHAPLGVGITQSSVEDLFLHSTAEIGKPFEHTGPPGFPYPALDILNVRSQKNFQEMRDVYALSKKVPRLSQALDQNVLKGIGNENLREDISWRSKHLGVLPTFWNLAQSDMAWQLSEGFGVAWHGAMSALKPLDAKADRQILSRHPFYESSQIVRDAFRLFHRDDGKFQIIPNSPLLKISKVSY